MTVADRNATVYRKTARITIAQEKSIPNTWNGTMFGDVARGLSASAELLDLTHTFKRLQDRTGMAMRYIGISNCPNAPQFLEQPQLLSHF